MIDKRKSQTTHYKLFGFPLRDPDGPLFHQGSTFINYIKISVPNFLEG